MVRMLISRTKTECIRLREESWPFYILGNKSLNTKGESYVQDC